MKFTWITVKCIAANIQTLPNPYLIWQFGGHWGEGRLLLGTFARLWHTLKDCKGDVHLSLDDEIKQHSNDKIKPEDVKHLQDEEQRVEQAMWCEGAQDFVGFKITRVENSVKKTTAAKSSLLLIYQTAQSVVVLTNTYYIAATIVHSKMMV